jgi:3-methylfumaryl-CoA hydratase
MGEEFSDRVGRSEVVADDFEPARTNALRAALGDSPPLAHGAPLPLLHHWLYFWDARPPQSLGADGHPLRGGFLPPVPLPRRMWAGGRLTFLQPLFVGEHVTRVSTILKVEAKSGRTGNLVFVTVRHDLSGAQGLAVTEEQDIVYRDAALPGSIAAPPSASEVPAASWLRRVAPDTVLLFRYSALTMNGHRIHYDRPYAMNEEAYPGLVVHGPLQATLLADIATRNLQAPISSFHFRGQAPAFDGSTLYVCGNPSLPGAPSGAEVWTEQGGIKNMVATVTCGAAA